MHASKEAKHTVVKRHSYRVKVKHQGSELSMTESKQKFLTPISFLIVAVLATELVRPAFPYAQPVEPLSPETVFEIAPPLFPRPLPIPTSPRPPQPPKVFEPKIVRPSDFLPPGPLLLFAGCRYDPIAVMSSADCSEDFCVLCTKSIRQLESGWCWNAAAQMVMNYHGYYFPQCTIADTTYGTSNNCCLPDGRPDPATNCRLIGNPGGFPQHVFQAYGFDYQPPNISGLKAPGWNYALGEIREDRPFIAWLASLTGNPAHVYVVYGFSMVNGVSELRVIDPLQGPSVTDPHNPPSADFWFQSWDSTKFLGDAFNKHTGDIAEIEP